MATLAGCHPTQAEAAYLFLVFELLGLFTFWQEIFGSYNSLSGFQLGGKLLPSWHTTFPLLHSKMI